MFLTMALSEVELDYLAAAIAARLRSQGADPVVGLGSSENQVEPQTLEDLFVDKSLPPTDNLDLGKGESLSFLDRLGSSFREDLGHLIRHHLSGADPLFSDKSSGAGSDLELHPELLGALDGEENLQRSGLPNT